MDLKILVILLVGTVGNVAANLRCYACSFSSEDSDQSCLIISETTNSVACPYEYCTIMRQEYLDPPGTVASFVRGCESSPAYLNHEIVDPTFRTFYRACTINLCNIGDGIQSVVGGSLSPTPPFEGANLLVPGTGNAYKSEICRLILTLSIFIFVFGL